MSTTMRAAVLVDVGRIEIRDVPRAEPARHEILVRVQATGLCGTDIHIVAGHANYSRDDLGRVRPLTTHHQILGHEITGVIEHAGSDVDDLLPGDRVVIDQGRTCVSERRPFCEYCETGASHQCEHYREHGITGLPGGFAEFVTVPAANAVAIRSSLSPECGALVEPLGCVTHSMDLVLRAKTRYSLSNEPSARRVSTVLVCGGGPAGLLFVQYLRKVAAYDGLLLVSEPNAAKRALAADWGADVVDPNAGDLAEQVRERTAGRGIELLIEASGAGEVFRSIPAVARKQATILMYGHGHAGVDLSVMNDVQFLEPTIITPSGASGGHDDKGRPVTYQRALRFIEEGTIDVGRLITHRYRSLDEVPAAFAGDHLLPGYVKGVVLQ